MKTTRQSPHRFHVPVMGIGFTIDAPVAIAPYGIDSVISLVNDDMIEAARAYHATKRDLPYVPIGPKDEDARARRITSYLNLVDSLVQAKTREIAESSWEDPKGISRYFQLLPDESESKRRYQEALAAPRARRVGMLEALRDDVVAGSIDVNIMTKLDGKKDARGRLLGPHESEADAALRGFGMSDVSGALVLSAGANPSLFAYLAEFQDFFPDAYGRLKKRIVLKVSDFRSAHVQGRMLARRGLWVSEYRIESGVNCGGHVFPTDGILLGVIMDEFKRRRSELREGLGESYRGALAKRGNPAPDLLPGVRITVQGGLGTANEARLCEEWFGMDGTGWGSPFLMVPEVVRIDGDSLAKLERAKPSEITLSHASPLGLRFWWLTSAGSETARQERIAAGYPGSVCTARHLALSEEFGDVPLCPGSRAYQSRKLQELDPADPDYARKVERLNSPACICVDLCGSTLRAFGVADAPPPAICPGPNIVNFQRQYSLDEMVDHIYGRADVLTRPDRPHMLLREAELYLDFYEEAARETPAGSDALIALAGKVENVCAGLVSYRALIPELPLECCEFFAECLTDLLARGRRLSVVLLGPPEEVPAVLPLAARPATALVRANSWTGTGAGASAPPAR